MAITEFSHENHQSKHHFFTSEWVGEGWIEDTLT